MGLIIQICSGFIAAVLITSPAYAALPKSYPLTAYVAGRAAEASGDAGGAARAYAAALTADPGNVQVALRGYRQAVIAGDWRLSLRAAQALATKNALPADARLLLYLDAIKRSDWPGARLILDAIEEQGNFDFLVPTLRAWVSYTVRDADPLALLNAPTANNLTTIYSREHRALLLLALKKIPEGVAAVKTLATPDDRGRSLGIAAAARLVALKDKEAALVILAGDHSLFTAARALVQAGKPLPGAVDHIGAASGLLLARIASDLQRDRPSLTAVMLARMAGFADPKRDEIKIILAQTLAANGNPAGGQAVLDSIKPGGYLSTAVTENRISLLIDTNQNEAALAAVLALSNAPNARDIDHIRLGDVYSRLSRFSDSAAAYDLAIKASGADASWALWLRYGGALEQAKEWARAKLALEKALALGPNQASVLNHLGYAMLERGENPSEALQLIMRANAQRPGDIQITDSLGWAFFKNGRIADAIITLERAVVADPGEPTIGEHLGDAYWMAGRRVDARYAWRAALIQAESEAAVRLTAKIADGLLSQGSLT